MNGYSLVVIKFAVDKKNTVLFSVGDPHCFLGGSRITDPDLDPLKIRADRGSRIADLALSDIRQILQIRLPNADPYYMWYGTL